jgi:hypothetical protein
VDGDGPMSTYRVVNARRWHRGGHIGKPLRSYGCLPALIMVGRFVSMEYIEEIRKR